MWTNFLSILEYATSNFQDPNGHKGRVKLIQITQLVYSKSSEAKQLLCMMNTPKFVHLFAIKSKHFSMHTHRLDHLW